MRAALERFPELGIELRDGKFELGGDGGEADFVIEPGKQSAAAGSGLNDVGDGGEIMTHGDTR